MSSSTKNAPGEALEGELGAGDSRKLATFSLGERLYGIGVAQVQEVTKELDITPIPLAPEYIRGLINLRGHIATAVDLRKLFGLEAAGSETNQMNVICLWDGVLLSLLVDKIGDVVEVNKSTFERAPQNLPSSVTNFMEGVYKSEDNILSVVEIDKILEALNERGKPQQIDI